MKTTEEAERAATVCRLPVQKIAKLRCHPALRYAPHAEHLGFVAYAGAETFAIHWAVWFVAAYLLATGFLVMIAKGN